MGPLTDVSTFSFRHQKAVTRSANYVRKNQNFINWREKSWREKRLISILQFPSQREKINFKGTTHTRNSFV